MRFLVPHQEPISRICKSGHVAGETFVRADGMEVPMRFLSVSGPALDETRHGIYCEACVTKANEMAQAKRAMIVQ